MRSTLERYRANRGLVRWSRTALRESSGSDRDLLGRCVTRRPRQFGTCRWCGSGCRRVRCWHQPCLEAYYAARGLTPLMPANQRCGICGTKMLNRFQRFCRTYQMDWREARQWDDAQPKGSCDHRLAHCVARKLGRRAVVRAFHRDNLWWLCGECHRVKTAADRRAAKG